MKQMTKKILVIQKKYLPLRVASWKLIFHSTFCGKVFFYSNNN